MKIAVRNSKPADAALQSIPEQTVFGQTVDVAPVALQSAPDNASSGPAALQSGPDSLSSGSAQQTASAKEGQLAPLVS